MQLTKVLALFPIALACALPAGDTSRHARAEEIDGLVVLNKLIQSGKSSEPPSKKDVLADGEDRQNLTHRR